MSGFTPEPLSPFEERRLLHYGVGITNIVARTTVTAAELAIEELRSGAAVLRAKVLDAKPRILAVLGVDAYRKAFELPQAKVGQQPAAIGGTEVWVLPNPSGLNAHYQLPQLVQEFRKVRDRSDPGA